MSLPFDASGLGGLMQGFQQRIQDVKDQANQTVVVGEAGGGLVKVHANGGMEVVKVEISPKVADDTEMLEDLITAATNDALRRARAVLEQGMSGVLGGLPLPPGLF